MDKKDILEKAHLEYVDKGDEMDTEKEGRNGVYEFITFFIMAILFMIFKATHSDQIFDYISIILYVIGVINIIWFARLKKTRYIVIGVIALLVAVACTVMFFKTYGII